MSSANSEPVTNRLQPMPAQWLMQLSRNYKPIHTRNKMKVEKKMNDDGRPQIEMEMNAAIGCLLLASCAILFCFLVSALCYGIYELVMWLLP